MASLREPQSESLSVHWRNCINTPRMPENYQQGRHIAIIGGGIIGCTSAYYITRHLSFNPALHKITILEATDIASGASGKAGGLLAQWAYPSTIAPLSYQLHEELASEHNGAQRWGYRKIHCGSVSAKIRQLTTGKNRETSFSKEEWAKLPKVGGNSLNEQKNTLLPKDLDWLDEEAVTSYSEMGNPSTTAQVHPYQFTTSMASLAAEKGAQIILGAVNAINYTNNQVQSVTYEDKASKQIHTINVTDIIICAGPWTSRIFPQAPIDAVRAHSVTIKADVSPYAIFSEIDLPSDFGQANGSEKPNAQHRKRRPKTVSPEIYARPDGEVYACGEGDQLAPLPATTALVQVDSDRCQDVIDYVSAISPALAQAEVLVQQACYLPSVSGGEDPLIGPTGIEGLLLATGHTCWGIQNSCATGKLISEIIWEGEARSADVSALDPRRVLESAP